MDSIELNVCTVFRNCRLLSVGGVQLDADADAPAQGEADVLLDALPLLRHHQDVLPRHQVQQEQHRPARQVVLQLQVCVSLLNFCPTG